MNRPYIQLRLAEGADSRFVWETNNHPTTRRWSIQEADIPWTSHEDWFARSLESPTRFLYIAEQAGVPVGVVRFDHREDEAAISVAVAFEARGRGVGQAIIAQASADHLTNHRSVRHIVALIRPDNQASRFAFTAVGYMEAGTVEAEGLRLSKYLLPRDDS